MSKKLFTLCLALIIAILPSITLSGLNNGSFVIAASEFTHVPNGDGTTTRITGYSGSGGHVEIPGSIEGLTVTHIGDEAFMFKGLTSVAIPDTITHIGVGSFEGNSLSSLNLPNSILSIGEWAFDYNSITNLIIPNSVTNIGQRAFGYNQLTNVEVLSPNVNYVTGVFTGNPFGLTLRGFDPSTTKDYAATFGYGFVAIEEVVPETPDYNYVVNAGGTITITGYLGTEVDIEIPSTLDELPVTHIGNKAFYSKGLTSVEIPDSVTHIGDEAFEDNNIVSVSIPDSVTHIGIAAFARNSLTSLELSEHLETLGNFALASNPYLRRVIINNDNLIFGGPDIFLWSGVLGGVALIASVGSTAELYNGHPAFFVDKTLPEFGYSENDDGTATINAYNWYDDEVDIPNVIDGFSVTHIANSVFSSKGLNSLKIPNSVIHIGNYSFASNNLEYVELPNSLVHIGNSAFASNKIVELDIPNSVTHIGNEAFNGNKFETLTIPDGVTQIGNLAFANGELTEVFLPSSLTRIEGWGAFAFNKIHSIHLPNSLTHIGEGAFYENRLEEIVIPENVIEIEDGVFSDNPLTTIEVRNPDLIFGDLFYGETVEGLTFKGYDPSTTKDYAETNNYNFIVLSVDPILSLSRSTDDYSITVDIAVHASTMAGDIVTQKWTFGEKSVEDFTTEGTVFTGTSFIATQNGVYTVYVEDEDGKFALETITVNNVIMKGDANLDGEIESSDWQIIADFILGNSTPTELQTYAADLNNDGKINVSDWVLVAKLILDQNHQVPQ